MENTAAIGWYTTQMLGILLIAIAEMAIQFSSSISKYEAAHRRESVYAIGFLTWFWTTIFLLGWGTIGPGEFYFSLASLPTFTLRALLEVAMMFVTIKALIAADRSTFSFLRTLTLPLILIVDVALGYSITTLQFVGIGIIIFGSLLLATRNGLSKRGKILSLLSAILAVATVSLFKYNITHYNSVEAEQFFIHLLMILVLIVTAYVEKRENLFRHLLKPVFLGQSLLAGIGGVLMSFAYLYAAASVITSAKRSFEILFSIIVGRAYFHEHHIAIKLLAGALVISGVSLTTFS